MAPARRADRAARTPEPRRSPAWELEQAHELRELVVRLDELPCTGSGRGQRLQHRVTTAFIAASVLHGDDVPDRAAGTGPVQDALREHVGGDAMAPLLVVHPVDELGPVPHRERELHEAALPFE